MNKSIMLLVGGALWAVACSAAPAVDPSSVTMEQKSSGRVCITYTLQDEAAVVTCDIRTNGVSIGAGNLTYMTGDVNRRVEPGTRTIEWRPGKAWPGHKITDGSVTAKVTAWAMNATPDYLVVDLVTGEMRYYVDASVIPDGIGADVNKTERMVLRKCAAAGVEWRLGGRENEFWTTWGGGNWDDEYPRLVTLTNDFYIGIYPVTQKQYYNVVGENPSAYAEADRDVHPVEQVRWDTLRGNKVWPADGHEVGDLGFFALLRQRTGRGEFDLPLEAQWEFAARAGNPEELYSGCRLGAWNVSENLKLLGPHKVGQSAAVGSYQPNAWGIYDLLAHVNQYCLDYYVADTRSYDMNVGPLATDEGVNVERRVVRGGSFNHDAYQCRICSRVGEGIWGYKLIGFRVACSVDSLR